MGGVALAQNVRRVSALTLLNEANRINHEEIELATLAARKAQDNQAMITYAATIKADHKANQEALETLSQQKNIALERYRENVTASLRNLKGAEFNSAYIDDEISDHQEALNTLKGAVDSFTDDPDMSLYLG